MTSLTIFVCFLFSCTFFIFTFFDHRFFSPVLFLSISLYFLVVFVSVFDGCSFWFAFFRHWQCQTSSSVLVVVSSCLNLVQVGWTFMHMLKRKRMTKQKDNELSDTSLWTMTEHQSKLSFLSKEVYTISLFVRIYFYLNGSCLTDAEMRTCFLPVQVCY